MLVACFVGCNQRVQIIVDLSNFLSKCIFLSQNYNLSTENTLTSSKT